MASEIDPLTWDFRAIAETDVNEAALYEYLRSCDPLKKEMVRYLDSTIPSWKGARRQIKVRDVHSKFTKAPPTAYQRLPLDLYQQFPEIWLLLTRFPDFPKPFLSAKRMIINLPSDKAFEIVPIENPPRGAKAFLIKHTATLREVRRDFNEWLQSNHHPPSRAGKRTTAGQIHLKRLAAHRLHKAGMSYSSARHFIREYVTKTGEKGLARVFPDYASHGAWKTAVDAAQKRIDMFTALASNKG